MEAHALEGGQRRRHLECVLLREGACAVDNIVFILSHLDLRGLAHVHANQVEVPHLLPNRLRHVLMRLWHAPSA